MRGVDGLVGCDLNYKFLVARKKLFLGDVVD